MTSPDPRIPFYVRFIIAGIAGSAAVLVTHPFDLVKYRMQMSGKGGAKRRHKTSFHAAHTVWKQERITGLYAGLSASLFYQAMTTTTRLGLYSCIVDKLIKESGRAPSITQEISAGLLAGFIGAIFGNTADIIRVRMSMDADLPPRERYNYKNVFNGARRLIREDAVQATWITLTPSVVRSMVLNVTQIVLYTNMKIFLQETGKFQDNLELYVINSSISALVTSLATAPIDIVRTRMMVKNASNGSHQYKGLIDGWIKIIKLEGFGSLWKGVMPTFAKILPHSIVIFTSLEFFTKMYKTLALDDKSDF